MNVKRYVLFFNIFFLLLLLAATFLFEWKPNIAGENFRPVSILADIKKDTLVNNPVRTKTIIASKAVNKNIFIKDYTTSTGLVNASGEQYSLSGFLQKLVELKKKKRRKIRIAYFGDSMIEGDLITEDLRKQLQDIFGGSGVGFVPVTSVVAGFRITVTHTFSDNWTDVNFKSDDKSGANLFISGHSFFGGQNNWVDYKAVNHPHLNNFSDISVLYGMPATGKTSTTMLSVNGKQQTITANAAFNEFDIKYDSSKEF